MSIIGITMGCPVGIGPEIIIKFFTAKKSNQSYHPVIIGDKSVIEHNARHYGININCYSWKPGEPIKKSGAPVFEVSSLDTDDLTWGQPGVNTGKAMALYIENALELCLNGHISAIVTCPITKLALQDAGFDYPGHTEMLAKLTNSHQYTMMMAGSKLRVTLASIHCSLKEAVDTLNTQAIVDQIRITHSSLERDFGITKPKIGVAGLNPHCGESGMFGTEESTIIDPAIAEARDRKINVKGPYPPDTIFYKAMQSDFDAVVCMYHDQGLIPFKLIHFNDGVNVTLGLPIVRTSVDHGTAYDIAGKGIASADSLKAAIDLAALIAQNRAKKS